MTDKIVQSSLSGEKKQPNFKEMCSIELERLVGQLLELTVKFEESNSPQGKQLYGKKMKKLQTKVTRLARLASA